MTVSITEFIEARLREDEAAAEAAEGTCHFDGSSEDADHYERHDPARVLREITAKRRVLERHCADTPLDSQYCRGCPGDRDGFPDTELNDCPEIRDLAYIWNDHSDWNPKWCPHAEGRHEADVTELPPARRAYTNACNRCGQGDGWHYRNRRTT